VRNQTGGESDLHPGEDAPAETSNCAPGHRFEKEFRPIRQVLGEDAFNRGAE
jgi:hypothetical protein